MSVDYYLQSRNIYKHLTCHLKEIIELYDEFIELTQNEPNVKTCNKDDDIKTLTIFKSEYEEKLRQLVFFKDFVNQKIQSLCEHTLVNDLIDITPDTSTNITYCSKCEYNQL